MPISRDDRPGLNFAAAAALVLLMAGCSSPSPSSPSADVPAPEQPPASEEPTIDVPPDLAQAFTRVLDRRAEAIREADRAAYSAGLSRAEPAFSIAQEGYFDNLVQLPLALFTYTLDRRSLVRTGDDYWVVVDLQTQLDGYDALPVLTQDRFRFSPGPGGQGRFVLSSVTDAEWEQRNKIEPQPWEERPIEVRSGVGVLGIFDAQSVRAAGPLVRSVERGIADVAGVVPYPWPRSVVLYALSDTVFLSTVDAPPGVDDPAELDGVTFTVPATPNGDDVASTRFALHPRMLEQRGRQRDRLVRHELTHVAIADRDDEAPLWLSEGLAEYVSVRPLAPEDRLISDEAITAAEAGRVLDLPADDTFNADESSADYGIAWWACEYLATTFGPDNLWPILDELNLPDGDPSVRLKGLVGLNSRQLARKSAKLMIATFDPEFYDAGPGPTPDPTDGPSSTGSADPADPSASPAPSPTPS